MFRFGFLFVIVHLPSHVFSQPNNGVAFINNLPNMTVGETYEIIIDGNGGGGLTIYVDELEGIHNCVIERWEFIAGNWIMTGTTMFPIITFVSGNKMIARAMSDSGNNPCSTISGEDFIGGSDSQGNEVDKIICVYSRVLPISYYSSLKYILIEHQIRITWSVATQINNEKYVIEHSSPKSIRDESNFSPIGEITGDGTSNETKHYTYTHKKICDGIYTVGCISCGVNYQRIHPVG